MQLLVNCISQRLVGKDENSFDVIIDMHNSHVSLEVINWPINLDYTWLHF
jgi:hypothetical protein